MIYIYICVYIISTIISTNSLVHVVVRFHADRHAPAFDLVQFLVGNGQVHLVDLRHPDDKVRRAGVRLVLNDHRGVGRASDLRAVHVDRAARRRDLRTKRMIP